MASDPSPRRKKSLPSAGLIPDLAAAAPAGPAAEPILFESLNYVALFLYLCLDPQTIRGAQKVCLVPPARGPSGWRPPPTTLTLILTPTLTLTLT